MMRDKSSANEAVSRSRVILFLAVILLVSMPLFALANADEDKSCDQLSTHLSCMEYEGCGWDKETNECFDEEEDIVNCYELMDKRHCVGYSGCRWENITNECYDIMPKWIREGQMVPLSSLKMMLKEMDTYNSAPSVPPNSQIDENLFVVLPNCLHPEEVEMIQAFQSQLGENTEMHDRSDDLEFHHTVHRIEPLMK